MPMQNKSVDVQEVDRATLTRLIAQEQIGKALADYAIGFDDRDTERFISAFHESAVLELATGRVEGHPAIRVWTGEVFRQRTMAHLTGNHHINVIDEKSAQGVGSGFALSSSHDGSVELAFGRLTDRYAKINDRWRISYRKIHVMSSFRLTGASAIVIDGKRLVESS